MEGEVVVTLGSLPTVLTTVWNQMASLVTSISAAPLLLIGLGFTFAFGTVKLAKKLMKRR